LVNYYKRNLLSQHNQTCFTLTFRSLSETFIRRSLFSSSSGSCHDRVSTWKEIGRTCGSACSCPRPGSTIVVPLSEHTAWARDAEPWLPSQPNSTTTARWQVLISHPAEGRRLSWPEWLLTYQDGIPANGHASQARGRVSRWCDRRCCSRSNRRSEQPEKIVKMHTKICVF